MQVGLDKLSFNKLQSQALVRAGQTLLNISFNFIKIFSINSGSGRRNPNATPAQSPVRWAIAKMTHHKMRTLTILFLLLSTLFVSAQQTIENPDSFVELSKGRYTLSYPNSWSVDTSKMFGMDILFRSPKTDSNDDFRENMNVFIQDLHGQNYNLSKMGKESETQIENMVTDVEIIDSKLDSTTSHQFYVLKYKGRQGKFLLTTIQQYYLKDEVGYALTFTIKNGQEQNFIRIADKMFDSFKLR